MRKLEMRKSNFATALKMAFACGKNRAEDCVAYPFPSSLELDLRKYAVERRLHFRWIFVFEAESDSAGGMTDYAEGVNNNSNRGEGLPGEDCKIAGDVTDHFSDRLYRATLDVSRNNLRNTVFDFLVIS